MRNDRVLPLALAVAGFAAIVIGIHQGLVHVAPGNAGTTITTGWDGELNHEERLLAALGAVGIAGTAGSFRRKRLAVVPVVMGGVVLFYALRAVYHYVRTLPLYTDVQSYGGDRTMFVLGAEPFLLIGGGLLLVGAGIVGWRRETRREDGHRKSPTSSSAA